MESIDSRNGPPVGGHPEYLHVVKLTHLIPESTVTIVPQIQEWSLVMEASGDQAGVVHPQIHLPLPGNLCCFRRMQVVQDDTDVPNTMTRSI